MAGNWQTHPDGDAEYWETIDSIAYVEGNKSHIERQNPYTEGTQEWSDWNKGFYNAYWGYQDHLSEQ